MTIVSIKANKVIEKELFKMLRGLLIEGERPDFVVFSEDEAEEIRVSARGMRYVKSNIMNSLSRPSMNNVLVDSEEGLVKLERYLS